MASSTNVWVLLGLGLAGILLIGKRFKKVIREDFGAFVQRFQLLPPPQPAPPKAPHPLTGLSFAVADMIERYLLGFGSNASFWKLMPRLVHFPLAHFVKIEGHKRLPYSFHFKASHSQPLFDIDGYVTGFGNPDWVKTHEPAAQTSPAVLAIIEGGATCVGKTVLDEMAYSIDGENKHYGTPSNPAAPSRIPGGSSSGSAVAVAADLVDFSLGIDTVGGVRIPGAFCGVLGFRTSHGAASALGVIPVAQSLDAVGLFAKDPSVLRRAGHVLLKLPYTHYQQPRRVIIADDCFLRLKIPASRSTQVVVRSTEKIFGRQVLNHANLGDYLASKVPSLNQFHNRECTNGELKFSSVRSLGNAMQLLLRHEFKNNHEEWINFCKLDSGPVVSAHLQAAIEPMDVNINHCHTAREETRSALSTLLKDNGILVIPTVAGPPPKLSAKEILSEEYQSWAFCLSAIASISGCCQVTVPLGFHEKCPVAVSFIARHGGDRFLLETVQAMHASLKEQADIAANSNLSSNNISQEESAEIAKEKGNNAYKEKQWQKAISFYSEAIKLNGKNATYYSNRAAAYLELASFLQAEADCTTAISLDKKNVKAYLRRGTAREMLGYYKEAIEDFQHALVLEPTNKTATLALNRLKKLFQ